MAAGGGGGGIKGFYRERKKTATVSGGVAKPSKKKGTAAGAAVGGSTAQPPSLISHGSLNLQGSSEEEEYGPEETALRQFDVDMRYGPCLGMSRLQRWERAARLGLHPPAQLEALLRRGGDGAAPAVNLECLWDARI